MLLTSFWLRNPVKYSRHIQKNLEKLSRKLKKTQQKKQFPEAKSLFPTMDPKGVTGRDLRTHSLECPFQISTQIKKREKFIISRTVLIILVDRWCSYLPSSLPPSAVDQVVEEIVELVYCIRTLPRGKMYWVRWWGGQPLWSA